MKNKLNIFATILVLGFSTNLYSMRSSFSIPGIDWAVEGVERTRREINSSFGFLDLLNEEKNLLWFLSQDMLGSLNLQPEEIQKFKESIINSLRKICKNIENLYHVNSSRMSEEYVQELIGQNLDEIKKKLKTLIKLGELLNRIDVNLLFNLIDIEGKVLRLNPDFMSNVVGLQGEIIDNLYKIISDFETEEDIT